MVLGEDGFNHLGRVSVEEWQKIYMYLILNSVNSKDAEYDIHYTTCSNIVHSASILFVEAWWRIYA